MNVNACNIFKIYTVCVCIYIYIYIIYTVHTHIYYVNKHLFWMRLIAINRLTALICIIISDQIQLMLHTVGSMQILDLFKSVQVSLPR